MHSCPALYSKCKSLRSRSAQEEAGESSSSESVKTPKKDAKKKRREKSSCSSSSSDSSKSSVAGGKGGKDDKAEATGDKEARPAENEEEDPDPEMNRPFCNLKFEEVGMWSENLCELDLKQDRDAKL